MGGARGLVTVLYSCIVRGKGVIQSTVYSAQHYSTPVPYIKSNVRNGVVVNWTVAELMKGLFRNLIMGKKLFLSLIPAFKPLDLLSDGSKQ